MAMLAGTVAAQTVGSAIVLNGCDYDVYVTDVPAAGGGYEQMTKTLSPNQTFEQQWTELANGEGWSIKLSKSTSLANIMQYEFTFHNDGIIWYDLSDVNGNPWDGDWEITAQSPSNTCTPKDHAYLYSTDDAYGMQACNSDATITVTLCSGQSQNASSAGSASSSAAASPSSMAASTYSSSTPPASTSASSFTWRGAQADATPDAGSSSSASMTTFATLTSSASPVVTSNQAGVTVTEIETAIVTDIVTATAYGRLRREAHRHHARHGHA